MESFGLLTRIRNMKKVMEPLLALQTLELGPAPENAENAAQIARLRQIIPTQIIGHYDRLMARGKKGLALVRHHVCSECHMSLSSGAHAQLLRGEDVMICESCGRYLYPAPEALAPESPTTPSTASAPLGEPAKAKKTRNRAPKKENGPVEAPAA